MSGTKDRSLDWFDACCRIFTVGIGLCLLLGAGILSGSLVIWKLCSGVALVAAAIAAAWIHRKSR